MYNMAPSYKTIPERNERACFNAILKGGSRSFNPDWGFS